MTQWTDRGPEWLRQGGMLPRSRGIRLGVLAILITAVAGCSGNEGGDGGAETTTPLTSNSASATTTEVAGNTTTTAVEVGAGESGRIQLPSPDWLIADDEFVYVKLDAGQVLRLDPTSGATVSTIEAGTELCQGLGVAFGSLWTCDGSDLVRIDPATDEIVDVLAVGKTYEQGNLVGAFDRLWILTGDGSQIVGLDPTTNQTDPPIDLGILGTDLAITPDAIWVMSNLDDALVRVDPVSRTVTGRIDGLNNPTAIDATDEVWLGTADAVVLVDPVTMSVTTSHPVSVGHYGGITVDGTDLWVRSPDQFLTRVDIPTGTILETRDEVVTGGGDVIVAFGAVWATAYDDALLVRQPITR